jgi:hypothetical protein
MTESEAWQEIFNLSYGNQWQPIPKHIKKILGLDDRLGILGGTICTQHSAQYVSAFINRLNKIGEMQK